MEKCLVVIFAFVGVIISMYLFYIANLIVHDRHRLWRNGANLSVSLLLISCLFLTISNPKFASFTIEAFGVKASLESKKEKVQALIREIDEKTHLIASLTGKIDELQTLAFTPVQTELDKNKQEVLVQFTSGISAINLSNAKVQGISVPHEFKMAGKNDWLIFYPKDRDAQAPELSRLKELSLMSADERRGKGFPEAQLFNSQTKQRKSVEVESKVLNELFENAINVDE